MKDGFVKLAAAIPSLKVADCTYNASSIIRLAKKAAEQGVVVLTFPELSVTGYSCSDLFFQETLIAAAERSVARIMSETATLDMLLVVGVPVRSDGKLYNCAAVIFHGTLLGIIPKTYLPTYNEFYESRHFASGSDSVTGISYAGALCPFTAKQIFRHTALPELAVAVEICEDVWCQTPPSVAHCAAGATVVLNLSASPEHVGKPEYRRDLVRLHSARNLCTYVFASSGSDESTTDVVYSGHSFICENGALLCENTPFGGNELIICETDVKRLVFERSKQNDFVCAHSNYYAYHFFDTLLVETKLTRSFARRPFVPDDEVDRGKRCSFILDMQSAALSKRLSHTGSKCALVGVSGGLDSTLALIVAVRSMERLGRPATDVCAVTMPCFGTGKRTRTNAEILCERLGVSFRCVDIAAAVKQHLFDIGHDETTYDVTYENAQARERTQVLMDLSNALGGLVVGTGDLSETALGWSTYNGDHMAMYNVNCSVPKTLVRYIVRYYADASSDSELKAVLYDILDTPVSPELVPSKPGEISQRTEEILGDYDLHDYFLYYFVRFGYPPEKIYRLACCSFDGVFTPDYIGRTLETFVRRFFTQQFKRSCTPDGVKVGTVALSPRGDWRMPSDASYSEWSFKR